MAHHKDAGKGGQGADEEARSSASDLIARASQSVPAVAAVCYALGLTIVNLHLGRFGYQSFGLIKTSYVTAGLWAVVVLWLAVLTIFFFKSYFHNINGSRWGKLRTRLWRGLLFVSVAHWLLNYIAQAVHCGEWTLVTTLGWGLLLIGNIWQYTPEPPTVPEVHPARSFLVALRHKLGHLPLTLPLLIGAGFLFLNAMASLWGQIPAAYGGGRPIGVVVYADTNRTTTRALRTMHFDPDSTAAFQALMIAREDDGIVLAPIGIRAALVLPRTGMTSLYASPESTARDSALARNGWTKRVTTKHRWFEVWKQ